MPIDKTRYSSRTSCDKLELYVYHEFYPAYHPSNRRRRARQTTKLAMRTFRSFVKHACWSKVNSLSRLTDMPIRQVKKQSFDFQPIWDLAKSPIIRKSKKPSCKKSRFCNFLFEIHTLRTRRNSPIPIMLPVEAIFADSFGSLYMNRTTPRTYMFIFFCRINSISYR